MSFGRKFVVNITETRYILRRFLSRIASQKAANYKHFQLIFNHFNSFIASENRVFFLSLAKIFIYERNEIITQELTHANLVEHILIYHFVDFTFIYHNKHVSISTH